MKDLTLSFKDNKETYFSVSFDTIMDFTEAYEEKRYSNPEYQNIEADFFQNPLLHKTFNSMSDLYNHCQAILK